MRAGEILRRAAAVLEDAPPLPGEEARYAEVLAVIAAAQNDPTLKAAMIDEAKKAEQELVDPLFSSATMASRCRITGRTQNNGAAFGTDYFTRTAVAKSNIFVNKPNETKYFYQDLDEAGARLNGAQPLHGDLREGPAPAGEGLLVPDAVQRAPLLRAERRSSATRSAPRTRTSVERRRLADDLRAGRCAGRSVKRPTGCRRRRAWTSRCTSAPTGRRRRSLVGWTPPAVMVRPPGAVSASPTG